MDSTNTELALDGGDEGWSLEECAGEGFECTREGLFGFEDGVEAEDADIFLA
jgi:hypothetical protein